MTPITIPARLAAALALTLPLCAGAATLYDGKQLATLVHEDHPTLALAARMLGRDLQALGGQAPTLGTRLADCGATCVVIARHDSALARAVADEAGVKLDELRGEWERYKRVVVPSRAPGRTYVLIAGSDPRGAVYGVVDLTREIGVSAWEWWADVAPRRAAAVAIADTPVLSSAPSVRYRGVFLNDEDWGLQPWAAKTYDTASKDIGPATYARIYELLWRLKANTVWPAMHDSTKPFYQIAGNAEMARDYGIVVGTSHAEPMMRNNVREWRKEDGAFNFFTNRGNMLRYWQARVDQVKDFDNIYSLGLRGVHDSPMEGADTPERARDAVAEVIDLQRAMLARSKGRKVEEVPQALTLYKEVLDVYKAGLKVPGDVTLVWPDDNYGYIQQLNTPAENARPGGAGVYYHLSYWGRPHDYLWLGTTHPALVREQLDRAYQTGARAMWIANVGDIKPLEYLTQYFLDLAFDQSLSAQTPEQHMRAWYAKQFGAARAAPIAALMREFYDLAWERRPEFMGFGQTEPTTPNGANAYVRSGGDEARRRLARYEAMAGKAEEIAAALPPERRDAYFELVLYPVRAAASLNARILKLELAAVLARQGQAGAREQVDQARAAHAALVADTARYNALAGGKWRHMMDLAPRRLPVFLEPVYPGYPAPARPLALPANKARAVSFAAASARPNPQWEVVPGLGSKGGSLRSLLSLPSVDAAGASAVAATIPPLEYSFEHKGAGAATIKLVAVPVHPLTSANGLRLGVSVDGGPVEVLDYRTHGRSDEWKRNVLGNSAVRALSRPWLAAGAHTLRVYALDPGFVLDRVDVVPDGAPDHYGAPPEK
ncbi:glycosyl hydrolase 115 family protein [Pseudoduganella namucuonensis]|uniref:Glycosyl hydrolase family 115 n=1 Tax=Pseudoduganella namucuonensis TaxID=1035707 RepID=A0A1I7LZ42_9BURK|nr:glycosyl hydrolase 115 family protein [Pseudoduganella namucuonensis]SFV14915.1 Glycosyl hydrolase family 115 [Pseudoduganella namucuonensis]